MNQQKPSNPHNDENSLPSDDGIRNPNTSRSSSAPYSNPNEDRTSKNTASQKSIIISQ